MSKFEEQFHVAWLKLAIRSLPKPLRQFKFHPTRQWRFDFCWPSVKLAVEINGGSGFSKGGHSGTNAQRRNELEKLNEAQRLGWRVLQFTNYWLAKKRIAETIDYVQEVLTNAEEVPTKKIPPSVLTRGGMVPTFASHIRRSRVKVSPVPPSCQARPNPRKRSKSLSR